MERKINRFCLVLLCICGQFPSTSPSGGLYLVGRFNGGFLRYEFGGLIFGEAYTWSGTYIFRLYLEKLTQLEKVSLTFSSDLWLRNDELTADKHILLITEPFGSINSYGVKDYKEVLQSRVLCFSSAWPVYSRTKIIQLKLFARATECAKLSAIRMTH